MMISQLRISNTYGIDVRDLSTLLEVLRAGSFTRASENLGYTQSAVSQQVSGLEAELGQRLVERKPVRATPAGARLAEHAAHILLRLQVARSELAQLDARSAPVRLSASPLADGRAVTAAIAAIQVAPAGEGVSLTTLSSHNAVTAVASGEVHAAFVDGFAAPDEPLHLADAGLLNARFVSERPPVVVVSGDHPLARRRRLELGTLADAPWIAAPRLVESEALARLGVTGFARTRALFEGQDPAGLLRMVAAGLGVALLPGGTVVDAEAYGVVAVALDLPRLVHRTELLRLRDATRTVL
jgi:DNA-binding transcriptional LysR family regulator